MLLSTKAGEQGQGVRAVSVWGECIKVLHIADTTTALKTKHKAICNFVQGNCYSIKNKTALLQEGEQVCSPPLAV